MEEDNKSRNVVNNFEAGSNCQVFNAPISGCVFAMPGSTVTQNAPQQAGGGKPEENESKVEGRNDSGVELCHFVHPEIEEEEAWRIHDAVKRLVAHQKVPEICSYLKELKQKGKLLLPSSSKAAYQELVRLGMPTGEGFSEKNFTNNYMK